MYVGFVLYVERMGCDLYFPVGWIPVSAATIAWSYMFIKSESCERCPQMRLVPCVIYLS